MHWQSSAPPNPPSSSDTASEIKVLPKANGFHRIYQPLLSQMPRMSCSPYLSRRGSRVLGQICSLFWTIVATTTLLIPFDQLDPFTLGATVLAKTKIISKSSLHCDRTLCNPTGVAAKALATLDQLSGGRVVAPLHR